MKYRKVILTATPLFENNIMHMIHVEIQPANIFRLI